MLSVKEAQNRITARFSKLETIDQPLELCLGRILSEPVLSDFNYPLFDNSSVDGFAVIADDVFSASIDHPVSLSVIGDIPAGSVFPGSLKKGNCARIMTGAQMPSGADAVVMIENTGSDSDPVGTIAPRTVNIHQPVKAGDNIRTTGSDLRQGQTILTEGTILRAQDIGVLAMLGKARIPVQRKPKVAILSGGDELIPLGKILSPGKIYESNSYLLSSLALNAGCDVINHGIAADNFNSVQKIIDSAAESNPDLIISSAGVSKGAFDYVREVVTSNGTVDFWRVNMRPGKPLAFGEYKGIPFFGLPGNPVASFVSFLIFISPVIDRLYGNVSTSRKHIKAKLLEEIESDGRESYLRAKVNFENNQWQASLTGHQGSGNLFSLVQANALLIIPSGVKFCPPGSEVDAWLLES